MRSIDYKGWAKYIKYLHDESKSGGDDILELAAGTCSVAKYLYKDYPKIIATDLSFQMLSMNLENSFNRVCCNMLNLPFKNKYNFVFSTFDSINYLITESDVRQLLNEVGVSLYDDGCFTFDVSLEKNSLKYVKSLNRKGKCEGIKYIQYSDYDKESRIHTNSFKIMLSNGKIVEEVHKQRIYDIYDYFNLVDECGFYVEHCFDAFTFDQVHDNSERAQFLIKKKCKHA